MSQTINVSDSSTFSYDIFITDGFQELFSHLKPFLSKGLRVCIVSDSNVSPLYENDIKNIVEELEADCYTFVFPAGEESKNLDTIQDLYEFLINNKFERRDLLIALGGGVTGDMVGFCAATYLRGISFIQIPTSLLAQTDSSIGGKTGVDFRKYKNMVGAFHQPLLCYMNMEVLKTLDDRQFLSGLGEIIKAALIKNASFFEWIIQNKENILNRNPITLEKMIYEACVIKRDIVADDPKEHGDRALLNFGHTLGHAVERSADFKILHGECVVLGMICALNISANRGMITEDENERIINLFKDFGYNLKAGSLPVSDILDNAKSDKKMEAGVLKFILLDGIGNGVIKKDVSFDEIERSLELILGD